MTTSASREGSPSGQPQMARTCCSNWSVTQTASVQCPELWTRRAIVDQQPAAAEHEELDAEDADIVERLDDAAGDRRRAGGGAGADAGGHGAGLEDVVAVDVLGGLEGGDGAVEAARDDDRDLAQEGHEGLEHQRHGRQRREGGRGVARAADEPLALAVVAEPRRLEDGGRADLPEFGAERGERGDGGEGRQECR